MEYVRAVALRRSPGALIASTTAGLGADNTALVHAGAGPRTHVAMTGTKRGSKFCNNTNEAVTSTEGCILFKRMATKLCRTFYYTCPKSLTIVVVELKFCIGISFQYICKTFTC